MHLIILQHLETALANCLPSDLAIPVMQHEVSHSGSVERVERDGECSLLGVLLLLEQSWDWCFSPTSWMLTTGMLAVWNSTIMASIFALHLWWPAFACKQSGNIWGIKHKSLSRLFVHKCWPPAGVMQSACHSCSGYNVYKYIYTSTDLQLLAMIVTCSDML